MNWKLVFPYAVIAVFMAVTVGHVIAYVETFETTEYRWIGVAFAVSVDAAIVVCSWMTRWKTTSILAWVGYFVFVAASGILNMAQVAPWTFDGWAELGAWAYALFPPVAISLLGFLARDAGKLRGKSRDKSEEVRELEAERRELRAEVKRLGAYVEPTRADFEKIRASANGRGTELSVRQANRELVQAGFWPVPDGTMRGWLEQ